MNYSRIQLETLRDLVLSARVQAALEHDTEKVVTGEFWNIELSKMIADMKIEERPSDKNEYDELPTSFLIQTSEIVKI